MIKIKLSKRNLAVITAYERGYRVKNGRVYNPEGRLRKTFIQSATHSPYLCFTIRVNGISQLVPVHRLVAFQKFKNKIFTPNIMVRHLNGKALSNNDQNIQIGTARDNAADKKNKK